MWHSNRRVWMLLISWLIIIALCAVVTPAQTYVSTPIATPTVTATLTERAPMPYSFARFNVDLFVYPPNVRLFVRLCISIDRKC